ncbi:MAG: NAD(P)/FAD-dependent oxidoreductase [Desulfosarcina sp.]|nr:NAD(P)/FAD-dependent oxidoreductase [Desulfobacterales bacterium]
MIQYDSIIVGSGISGMTLALLMAMNRHSVLLLEKNPRIGGAMARFYRKGIPFDTGFHFTGGFNKCGHKIGNNNGLLQDMLAVLGISNEIVPVFITGEQNNRLVFESEQAAYAIPTGYPEIIEKIKEVFPGEEAGIDRYFEMIRDVCLKTSAMNLRRLSLTQGFIEEDFISLDNMLCRLTDNALLKGLLSAYSMCYGVKPSEISFANHSRVSYSLYESIARVEDGGDAFIRAFKKRFSEFDIDIRCGEYIVECDDIKDKHIGRFILNTGEEISSDCCIFTIHPQEILKTLPEQKMSKAFINRANAFEQSAGFFSVYGVLKDNGTPDKQTDKQTDNFAPSILSLFPEADANRMIDPAYSGDPALVIMKSQEMVKGKPCRLLNAFEVSFPEHVTAWKNSKPGNRPSDYHEYKQKRTESIKERVLKNYPEFRNSYKVLDASSILTCRDFLNSPHGSAYGIKQKTGQINFLGKIAFRNIYAAGQSSVLPGIMGAMISSFIVARNITGKDFFHNFINKRLG